MALTDTLHISIVRSRMRRVESRSPSESHSRATTSAISIRGVPEVFSRGGPCEFCRIQTMSKIASRLKNYVLHVSIISNFAYMESITKNECKVRAFFESIR